MSGSYNTICAVAAELREEYPQAVIEVIDSISATLGTGFLCMDALELAESGMDCKETADEIRKRIDKIEIYFIVENFRHLVAGGRVSPVIGKIGDVLNIKPILTIQEGKIVLFKKARGLAMAFKNIKEIADSGRVKRKGSIFVHNKELYTMCNDNIPTNYHIDLNLIISSHVGPDTTGIAIERE
jgi:DegV family protein with EDD domain